MQMNIATKEGKLFGAGISEEVSFPQGYDNIETFQTEEAYNARLAELREAV